MARTKHQSLLKKNKSHKTSIPLPDRALNSTYPSYVSRMQAKNTLLWLLFLKAQSSSVQGSASPLAQLWGVGHARSLPRSCSAPSHSWQQWLICPAGPSGTHNFFSAEDLAQCSSLGKKGVHPWGNHKVPKRALCKRAAGLELQKV